MHLLNSLAVGGAVLSWGVQAHVQVIYPKWRGNSFEDPFSQLIQPCELIQLMFLKAFHNIDM